ncbi:virion core protein, T7 gp14 family [Dyella silvatica]|uniref:virion core protein, T7 gp14 family n=1 Tax=Dyella silvatica TaxID=2992128 RepID=UPI0022591BF0|nr:hypothetical protein [Dyella silvatica]
MCAIAVPIIMAVVAAGTAAYQANQNKHAVEAQMREQQKQIDQSASAQTEDRMKAAREARASARAASAESGVSGNSVDAVLNDLLFQSSQDVARIEKNRQNGIAESTQQARSRFGEINGQLASSVASSVASAYAKRTPTIPTQNTTG